ncbi:MAG: glycerol-3-phosphate dehydrogenase C-terminal domain-containing protein [Candidatus Promineifilaceae bacterium]
MSRTQGTALLVAAAQAGELDIIPGTQTLWAELRWAARAEAVSHLDDLLLRRVRLGILLPEGGAALLPRIRTICQAELGWDDGRWQSEQAGYVALVRGCYSVPDTALVPDWRALLAEAKQAELAAAAKESEEERKRPLLLTVMLALSILILWRLTRPSRKKVSPT